MPTNKWQLIIDAILTKLRTITTTNGYETNVGNNIFEWRANPLEESEMPGIVLRDTFPEEIMTVGAHEHTLLIELFIFTAGADAVAQARKIIADLNKAMGSIDRTWGGLAEDTVPANSGGIGTDQANKFFAVAVKPYNISYTTEPFNAYQ